MRIRPKHSGYDARSNAQLESLVLQGTVAVQNLSHRLLKVQDEERRRIARDLHDSTGQTLTVLKISADLLRKQLEHDPCASGAISEIVALADQALKEIRTLSYLLHPPLLDEAGFTSAARWYCEGFAKRSGITVKLDLVAEHERLPIAIEIALFRVLQESLTNVQRHSGALEVSIRFQRQAETAILEIEDFGRGIPQNMLKRLRAASAETGVGLAGMRERLHELSGKCEIESDGRGTRLRAIVPLSPIILSTQQLDCRFTDQRMTSNIMESGLALSSNGVAL
jgi:two-component system, NarL family, sensor kinase